MKEYLNLIFYRNLLLFAGVFLVCLTAAGCDILGTSGDKSDTFMRLIPATDGTSTGSAWARAIVEADDDEYLVAGEIQTTEDDLDVYAVLLDKNGEIVWENTFGSEHNDQGYDLIRTRSGDFVITGINRNNRIYFLRIDKQGEIVTEKTYLRDVEPEHSRKSNGFAIQQTDDQGFVIAGRTSVPHPGGRFMAPSLLRLDSGGEELWFNDFYDGVGIGHAIAVAETSSGNFLVPGLYASTWPVRVRRDGVLTQPVREDHNNVVYADIVETEDGNFITAGAGFSSKIITVSKITAAGDPVWTKTYERGNAHSVTTTSDGGIIVAGSLIDEEKAQHNLYNLYFFKIDQEGELEWDTTWELKGNAELFGVAETRNGEIIATGRYQMPQYYAPLVLRADENGQIENVGEVVHRQLSNQ